MNRADCWRPQLGFKQAGRFLDLSKLKLFLGWHLFSPRAKLCLCFGAFQSEFIPGLLPWHSHRKSRSDARG